MLEAIRKRSASLLVKLLLLLLVLSFGLWGIGDVISPDPQDEWAAKVGDVEISTQLLRDQYQAELRRLRQVLGADIERDQARLLGLPAHALQQLVNRTLLDRGAADLALVASDDIVRRTIQSNPAFQIRQGQFDKELFDQLVRNSGLTEAGFLESVRGDIVREQLVGNLLAGSAAPQILVDALYRYRNETRVVTYARVPDSAMDEPASPDEATLRNFYDENLQRFTAPEYRSVTALVLSADDLVSEISITDEELEALYQDRAAEFSVPETRTLEQMVFQNQQAGERARERITTGADFVAVAKEDAGLDADSVKLGAVSRQQILPELADVAFQLTEGRVSELIQSPLGWHLVRVTSIDPGKQQPLEDVKEQLEAELARERTVDALIELSISLEDALGGGATLEEAGGEIDVQTRKIGAIDRDGLDAEGEPVPDLPGGFVDTVFETDENSESALIEADGGDAYFVVRVDEIAPASPIPFESARDAVDTAWISAKRHEAASEAASAIALRIKQGQWFTDIAADKGLSVRTTPPITRSGDGGAEALQPAFVNAAFAADPEEPFSVSAEDGAYVGTVTKVSIPDPGLNAEQRDALEDDLRRSGNNELLSQFTAALTRRYPVEINTQAMDQIY